MYALSSVCRQTWGCKKSVSVMRHGLWLPGVSFSNRNKATRVAPLNYWEVKYADDWVTGRSSDFIGVGCSFGTGIFNFPPSPAPTTAKFGNHWSRLRDVLPYSVNFISAQSIPVTRVEEHSA